jgi:regulator of sigma E protease
MQSVKDGIWVTDSLMSQKIGLQNGDKIESINGEPVKYFDDLPAKILLGKQIVVDRDGKQKILNVPVNVIEQLVEQKGKHRTFLEARIPVIVGQLDDSLSENARNAGLKLYDKIIAVDSTPVKYFDQVAPLLEKKKGDSVWLTVQRNNEILHTKTAVDTSGKIGFYVINDAQADSLGILKLETKKYSFLASFPAGVRETGKMLVSYIQQFKMILNPETGAYKGLGGFKAMASIFPDTGWNWEAFWKITALFSVILAFMNLLPIPALDGGHVVFTIVEMITGRKPSDKFLEYAQIVGMVILFALLIYANGNDWFGWGRGH